MDWEIYSCRLRRNGEEGSYSRSWSDALVGCSSGWEWSDTNRDPETESTSPCRICSSAQRCVCGSQMKMRGGQANGRLFGHDRVFSRNYPDIKSSSWVPGNATAGGLSMSDSF